MIRAAAPGRQAPSELQNAAELLYSHALELSCAPPYRRLTLDERTAKLESAMNMVLIGLSRKQGARAGARPAAEAAGPG
jgi:hypothetical protein